MSNKEYWIILAFFTGTLFPQIHHATASSTLRCRDDPKYRFHEMSIAGQVACMNDNHDFSDIFTKKIHRKRRIALYRRAWPKNDAGFVEIPYQFHSSTDGNSRSKCDEAFTEIQQNSCIRFRQRTTNDVDYILIQSVSGNGCSSNIGRVNGEQILQLESTGCLKKGIIIHELLHALGFLHTMARRDVERYLYINRTNIPESIYLQNFVQHTYGEADIFGEEFCYSSVMMYGRKDFAINREYDVITPLIDPNMELGQTDNWSQCDVNQLNRMYQCDLNRSK